jgi:hypothetical protein
MKNRSGIMRTVLKTSHGDACETKMVTLQAQKAIFEVLQRRIDDSRDGQ